MIEVEIEIINKLGLHARAAAKFVTLASRFASEIHVQHNAQNINGKSIMGVMMLAAAQGAQLQLRADGDDEQQAIDELSTLINNRFDEES